MSVSGSSKRTQHWKLHHVLINHYPSKVIPPVIDASKKPSERSIAGAKAKLQKPSTSIYYLDVHLYLVTMVMGVITHLVGFITMVMSQL